MQQFHSFNVVEVSTGTSIVEARTAGSNGTPERVQYWYRYQVLHQQRITSRRIPISRRLFTTQADISDVDHRHSIPVLSDGRAGGEEQRRRGHRQKFFLVTISLAVWEVWHRQSHSNQSLPQRALQTVRYLLVDGEKQE